MSDLKRMQTLEKVSLTSLKKKNVMQIFPSFILNVNIENIHPSSYVQATQEPKGQFADSIRGKEALNKPGYPGGMMDFNHFDPNFK